MIKSIILLSGGLDSLVSLGLKKEELNIDLALTFDYGQISAQKEIEASEKICKYYNIKHQIIKLDFLREITQSSLVNEQISMPDTNSEQNAKSLWVPNRNGLFLNIAASYADSYRYDYIIIGANKQEAKFFPDNSAEFIDAINKEFEYSTMNKTKAVAPLLNYDKNDIVMLALKNNLPLELTMSCYQGKNKNCGMCTSCKNLKNALLANNDSKYIKILFD